MDQILDTYKWAEWQAYWFRSGVYEGRGLSEGGVSSGDVALIVIGVVFGLIAVAMVAYLACRDDDGKPNRKKTGVTAKYSFPLGEETAAPFDNPVSRCWSRTGDPVRICCTGVVRQADSRPVLWQVLWGLFFAVSLGAAVGFFVMFGVYVRPEEGSGEEGSGVGGGDPGLAALGMILALLSLCGVCIVACFIQGIYYVPFATRKDCSREKPCKGGVP